MRVDIREDRTSPIVLDTDLKRFYFFGVSAGVRDPSGRDGGGGGGDRGGVGFRGGGGGWGE